MQLRNEGEWWVIGADGNFFTGLYHDGLLPQISDNPMDAAQFNTESEADAALTRAGYAAGLRVKRMKFALAADIDPRTQLPWLGPNGRPIGTMVMTCTEIAP